MPQLLYFREKFAITVQYSIPSRIYELTKKEKANGVETLVF
jgi:hypothetical protein